MSRTFATAMGHLDQEKQGLQSTKITTETKNYSIDIPSDVKDDFFPPRTENLIRVTNDCVAALVEFKQTHKAYSDLTGRFPHRSSRGNEYILIVYDYDSNAILAEPLKSRQAAEITRGWEVINTILKKRGVMPNLYVLDNEISGDLKWAMTKNEIDWQIATPHLHRTNSAERAIRTFKNHFIAGLCTTNENFPIAEWDPLLPQAIITLNLLRNLRVNPKLSSYAYLYGPYDFKAHPMAPPGTLVAAHSKPNDRKSWDPHARRGFYIGPCLNHYRNFTIFMPDTNSEIVTDTVNLFSDIKEIPEITHDEYLQQSLMDILAIIQSRPKTNLPSLQFGDEISAAIITVANLLNKANPRPIVILNNPKSKAIDPPEELIAHISKSQKIPRVKIQQSDITAKVPRVHKSPSFKQLALYYLQAQELAASKLFHIYDTNGKKESLESLMKKDPIKWGKALSNEWGRLAQGNKHGVVATNTILFITKDEIPQGRDITYASFVCDYRPLKSEPFRIRIVAGGDCLSYGEDSGSPATDLLETKLLLNSTISDADRGARFMSSDLKDYFLGSPMSRPEYMKVHISKFPEDIILQYNLKAKMDTNGYIYIKIMKGMYGLKQAAILAYNRLVQLLAPHGYYPEKHTVGLWAHVSRPTKFCLCVDDFGIKYFTQQDADHLLNALKGHYKVSTDWTGNHYCGLTLQWNYSDFYVDISIPGYVAKQLNRFQHPKPQKAQYAPHRWSLPSYGQSPKAVEIDKSNKLNAKQTNEIQSISGSFLYYGRAVDPTILPALTDIASMQSKPTENTRKQCEMLMDYLHTYSNAVIRYRKSDMILYVDSDAAYLVLPNARSRVAGHFYLGNKPPSLPTKPPGISTNGPIITVCKSLRHVVLSAAEAETGAAFHNSKQAIPIRRTLEILGHKQHEDGTPFKMDNAVTHGFIHNNIKQKQSKSWKMKYHWLRDKQTRKDFRYYWDKGVNNEADYFTKHHPPKHHIEQRSKYILKGFSLTEKLSHIFDTYSASEYHPDTSRGCVDGDPPYRWKFPRVSRMTSGYNDVAVLPLRHRLQ